MSQDTPLLMQEKFAVRQKKRAVKAAERHQKSDALKEEGNAFFRNSDFHEARDRYQQAIDVHGPSEKPILLANLAATYLKLGMYMEAHHVAERALIADPNSVKARYRRGTARKHLEMWTAAEIDFLTVLTLEPENKDAQAELAYVQEKQDDPQYWDEEDEVLSTYSDYEAPMLEDDPQLAESLSESSDCEHTGNGIPCKFYNRTECRNGHACRFSHAPDDKSERDALGRNVCRYYLMGVCKFGDRCSYSHSKEYLLHKGWWSTAEWIDKEKQRYDFIQMCNKAIVDYDSQTKAAQTSNKKKQPKGKKKGGNHASGFATTKNPTLRGPSASIGQSSQRAGMKSKKKRTYSSWDGYGSDGNDGNGMFGFTGSDVEELLCQGVKPWDDDAWDVLNALHDYC